MKSIKKLLTATLAVLVILALVSCAGIFGGDTQDGGGDNSQTDGTQPDNGTGGENNGNTDTTATNDPKSYTRIIYSDETIDLFGVRTAIMGIVGPAVSANLYSEIEESDGEVVFGESDRAITAKAKAALAELISASDYYDCGYIVYVDGANIAVYWQYLDMADIAVEHFIDVCIDEQKLATVDGVAAYKLYDKREFDVEKSWLALEAKAGAEVTEALKRLYNYYDKDKLVGWMGNLYDPEIGGFYYSISARDNYPFLPDIESTHQILGNLVTHGALASYNDLPEEIRVNILDFVRGTQSTEDGYFYHPQWPQGRENLNTDRYGRDLNWATDVISKIDLDTDGDGILEDQYPLYCAPNGNKCAEHVGTDDTCFFPVSASYYSSGFTSYATGSVTSSVSSAISKLSSSFVSATVSYRPDYSSREAFSKWLEEYNASIKIDSGKAHNLAALRQEITAKGYKDIVMAHLLRVQEEVYQEQIAAGETPTGLWQKTVDYNAVWGLLKYMPWFNSDGWTAIDLKYVPYIAETCVKVMAMPADGEYHMNDLYNMWNGLANLISNVRVINGADKANIVFDIVRENAAELVVSSLEKIKPFRHDDGSFSYNSDGTTQPKIYGTPISTGGSEGDVNAVALCVNMYRSVFHCMGYTEVPLYTRDDGQNFIDVILECEPIEKNPQATGELKFTQQTDILRTSSTIKSSIGKVAVTADPEDSSNSVLYFASGHIDIGDSDTLNILPVGTGSNCYIFETDIYVIGDTSYEECLYQISVGNGFMIALFKDGNTIKVTVEPNAQRGNDEILMGTFSTDEWHTIRFEVYVPEDGNDYVKRPEVKVWIDSEYMGTCEKYLGYNLGNAFSYGYTNVKFYALRNPETYVYLDNIFASIEDKNFDANDDTISDSRG